MVILFRFIQFANTASPMLVTLFGITRFVTKSPFIYKFFALYNGLASELAKSMLHQAARSLMCTAVSPVQPENADSPMLVTLLPITTLVSPVQSLNASSQILVTLLPITTFVSPEHSLNA